MRQYGVRHSGAAIVCGGGPTLYSDLDAARRLRPGATVVGANFSCCLIRDIEHVWTQHLEIAQKIRESAGRCVYVHSRPRECQHARAAGLGPEDAMADYLWPDLGWVGGSSGFAAALWAKHGMGFDEVIMAGVPLDADVRKYDGAYNEATTAALRPPQHDGGTHFCSPDSMEHWQQCINAFKKRGKTEGIVSMSGWTARALGVPA